MRRLALVLVAIVLASSLQAAAVVHLMVIEEVFVGPPGDEAIVSKNPNDRAQYIVLRMTAGGQTLTSSSFLRVEDADGRVLGRFGTFTANVANGGGVCTYPACPAIVIGTQRAKNLFSFAFNQIVDAEAGRVALPAAGGRVCFMDINVSPEIYDCVAWGNFDCTRSGGCALPNGPRPGEISGNTCDLNHGTPARATTGLEYGFAIDRTAFNCAAKENSTQYARAFPRPVNNAGQNDNTDSDNDGLINVLDCADADTTRLWSGAEVTRVLFSLGSKQNVTWRPQNETAGSAVSYDVARGPLSQVSTFGGATCSEANSTDAATTDATSPVTGNGFYYDVRAGNATGCVGTYGTGRAALDPVCP